MKQRIVSGLLAAVMLFSVAAQPMAAYAADSLSAILSSLSGNRSVSRQADEDGNTTLSGNQAAEDVPQTKEFETKESEKETAEKKDGQEDDLPSDGVAGLKKRIAALPDEASLSAMTEKEQKAVLEELEEISKAMELLQYEPDEQELERLAAVYEFFNGGAATTAVGDKYTGLYSSNDVKGKNKNTGNVLLCIEPMESSDDDSELTQIAPLPYLCRNGANGERLLEEIYATLQVGYSYNMGYWLTWRKTQINDEDFVNYVCSGTVQSLLKHMMTEGFYTEAEFDDDDFYNGTIAKGYIGYVYSLSNQYMTQKDEVLPGLTAEAVSAVLSEDGKKMILTYHVTQKYVYLHDGYQGYTLTLQNVPADGSVTITSNGVTKPVSGSSVNTADLFTYEAAKRVTDTIVVTIPAIPENNKRVIGITAKGWGAFPLNRDKVMFFSDGIAKGSHQECIDIGLPKYSPSWIPEDYIGYAAVSNAAASLTTPEVTGKFRLVKQDGDNGNPLAQVRFGLYNDAGCREKRAEFTTDAQGSYLSEDLPVGTYYIKELTARTGYVLNTTVTAVSITQGKTTDIQINNRRATGTASITKTDSRTGHRLAGVRYGLYAAQPIVHPDGKTGVVYQKDGLVGSAVTNDNGVATLNQLYLGSYYWKELEPRSTSHTGYVSGYRINPDKISFTLTYADQTKAVYTSDVSAKNEMITGTASITKTDARTGQGLEGVRYGLYAAQPVVHPDGKTGVVYQKDALIGRAVTNGNGVASVDQLYLGSYYWKELEPRSTAHDGYVSGYWLNPEKIPFALSYGDQTKAVYTASVNARNEMITGTATITKTDARTGQGLEGVRYGLYAAKPIVHPDGKTGVVYQKDGLVGSAVTNKNGVASLDRLYMGNYYWKELQPRSTAHDGYVSGYQINSEKIPFTLTCADRSKTSYTAQVSARNEMITGTVQLKKTDGETGTAQGDATLAGAVYDVYAKTDVIHPDGHTGRLYRAWVKGDSKDSPSHVGVMVTDETGSASLEHLYPGVYLVVERTASQGYQVNPEPAVFTISCTDLNRSVVTVTCPVTESVNRQAFQLIKVGNDGQTDMTLLKGAGFSAYLRSSLPVKADGTYDFDRAQPVVIAPGGATELFTDDAGYACSIPLPYGTYVVRETTVPHNYKPVEAFEVRITEHKPDTPQGWRVLTDDKFEAKLKIVKTDDETGRAVLAEHTEFRVFDLEKKKYVEQVTTYPSVTVHSSYFTDGEGCLVLPQPLKAGRYRIEEIKAPEGYTKNGPVEITLDVDSVCQVDQISGDLILEAIYEDHPVKGKLIIVKTGEVVSGYEEDFTYAPQPLADAVFEVYAAEDIYTADFQKDEDGNRILQYAGGALVAELTTDADGRAVLEDLPLGTYRVVETKAPEGYLRSETEQTVTFAYKDQDTPVVEQCLELYNERQKVEIVAVKQNVEDQSVLAGAEFGLYAREDILRGAQVILPADTLLDRAETGDNGKALFERDLPKGNYYVQELRAPEGFLNSEEIIDVEVDPAEAVLARQEKEKADADVGTDQNESTKDGEEQEADPHTDRKKTDRNADSDTDTEEIPDTGTNTDKEQEMENGTDGDPNVFYLEEVFRNEPTTVAVIKRDLATEEELDGAVMAVVDQDGQVVDTWTTVKGELHLLKGLHVGETYLLQETLAPYGYLKATDVEFTVADTAEIQTVEMRDALPTGKLIINKRGEFLKKVSWADRLVWMAYGMFDYVGGFLADVTFEVYAAEEIALPGRETEPVYQKDELVTSVTTDEQGIAQLDGLPLGRYYVVEKATAQGYVLDDTPRMADLTYRDQNTPVVTYHEDWQNSRRRAKVTVIKTEKGSQTPLEGAVFALCAKEAILSGTGEVLMEADTVIEQKVTDQQGTIVFSADLPVNGRYYVKEVQAPSGYLKTEEIKTFDFMDGKEKEAETSIVLTFENEPEPEPEPVPEPTPEPETKTPKEPETEAETETEPESETEPQTEPETETRPVARPEKPDRRHTPAPGPAPSVPAQPGTAPAARTELESTEKPVSGQTVSAAPATGDSSGQMPLCLTLMALAAGTVSVLLVEKWRNSK